MLASRTFLLIPGLLLLLPQSGARDTAEPALPRQTEANGDLEVKKLGDQILQESREVLNLLNKIVDRETAEQTAQILDQKLKKLDCMLRELEKLPLTNERDTQTIHAGMAELTHISQSCLTVMQKLNEIGAYGSDALMEVFSHYRVGENQSSDPQADDMPHGQLCNALADAIEDALYTLRKVHDEASARDCSHTVEDMMPNIERTNKMLSQLDPLRTAEQRDALQPIRERLLHVSSEVRTINEQLQQKEFYGVPELGSVLERLIRSTIH